MTRETDPSPSLSSAKRYGDERDMDDVVAALKAKGATW